MAKLKTKKLRVFEAFLRGEKHTRFSAARELHDTCLHSTVSTIQRDYGVRISRALITVPGYMGSPTQCCLYWLENEEIDKFSDDIKKAPDTSDQTNEEGTHNEQN